MCHEASFTNDSVISDVSSGSAEDVAATVASTLRYVASKQGLIIMQLVTCTDVPYLWLAAHVRRICNEGTEHMGCG